MKNSEEKVFLPNTHWRYFLSLERDLITCSHFVEFTIENFKCYSIEFAKLLMASAAEFEVVSKLLCGKLSPEMKVNNIKDIQKVLTQKLPNIFNVIIQIPSHNLYLKPFTLWNEPDAGLEWWRAYNGVKHDRGANYPMANLQNTLHSMAALFCILLHAKAHILNTRTIETPPSLFDIKWYGTGEPATSLYLFSLPGDVAL